MEILKSAPRVPRMNAHCERIIGSIRREALVEEGPEAIDVMSATRLSSERLPSSMR
jgi:hypothetical protein